MDTHVENRVEDNGMSPEPSQRKTEPTKGKRYSPAQRQEILEFA